eukprot:5114098-Pyramimonas_sp.AAC.1
MRVRRVGGVLGGRDGAGADARGRPRLAQRKALRRPPRAPGEFAQNGGDKGPEAAAKPLAGRILPIFLKLPAAGDYRFISSIERF